MRRSQHASALTLSMLKGARSQQEPMDSAAVSRAINELVFCSVVEYVAGESRFRLPLDPAFFDLLCCVVEFTAK